MFYILNLQLFEEKYKNYFSRFAGPFRTIVISRNFRCVKERFGLRNVKDL